MDTDERGLQKGRCQRRLDGKWAVYLTIQDFNDINKPSQLAKLKAGVLFQIVALWTCVVLNVHATTFYVDANGTNATLPYAGWPTAATNIQDAIDASSDGDLILVTNGVYATGGESVNGYSLLNRVVINKAVTVQSVNGPTATLIQGFRPGSGRCAYLTNNAVLIGFTLTNGSAGSGSDIVHEFSGGGVWCESSGALVSNCVLTANTAFNYGGASYSGTLSGCTLTNNSVLIINASQGGGAWGGVLTNCVITHNSAKLRGGGGAASNLLLNCTLNGNWSTGNGDGVCSNVLIGCTLNGNWSTVSGGGAFSCSLTNCILSGNWSTNGGGAVFGTLVGCTLTNNLATQNGGAALSNNLISCSLINNRAVFNGGGAYFCTLSNCTLSGNSTSAGSFPNPTTGGGACGGLLYKCVISNNYAYFGGGAASNILNNCLVSSNAAADGGGAFSCVLNSCSLSTNKAGSFGGGSHGGILNMCVLSNNHTGEGGADTEGGSLNNSLVIQNSSTGLGTRAAGVENCQATNCTIVLDFGAGSQGQVSGPFVNCIIEADWGDFGAGSVTFVNCCIPGIDPGSGWITNDPAFVNPVGGDFHLQSNSPCINSGNNAYVSGATDLDGNPRIAGGTVDMGAY